MNGGHLSAMVIERFEACLGSCDLTARRVVTRAALSAAHGGSFSSKKSLSAAERSCSRICIADSIVRRLTKFDSHL